MPVTIYDETSQIRVQMLFLDLFRRNKGSLSGEVIISGLPEHKELSVMLYMFRVESSTAPLPFNGSPPKDSYPSGISIREMNDPPEKPLKFKTECKCGFYHLDVGVIAIRRVGGKLYAHVEHFFPHDVPSEIVARRETSVRLNIQWPPTPIEDLPSYGTIYPSKKLPKERP